MTLAPKPTWKSVSIDPHPVQDARKLACDRDDRAQHARPFGDPQAPRPQRRPFPDPQQKACGCLAERLANRDVTLFGNATFIVDRGSRLVSSWRQAKMRANCSRSRKAERVINTNLERKGRNGADAGNGHQPTTNRIMLDDLQEHLVQSFVALEDRPPYVQHGLDHHKKYRIAVLDQLADPCFVVPAADGANQQTVSPQRATNMVFEVDQLALEELPVGQQRAHLLHLDILDMDRAVPAQAHHLRDAAGIVAVGLVAHRRQRNTHMARFDNNDRDPGRLQFAVQPDAERRRFDTDAIEAIRVALKSEADRLRLRARPSPHAP